MHAEGSTIVAQATPPGRGGVGVIRVSGPLAYFIAQSITHRTDFLPRTAYFAAFYNQQNELIDQGIAIYFKAPHSFTGEDVVEFQGHGAPIVLDELVQTCVFWGAVFAKPGEFSERAYLNDKIDLTQAEAIADLIDAHSKTSARMAMRSLQGAFSKTINELNNKIIHLRLYVEAAIDFPQEEIDFLSDSRIHKSLEQIIEELLSIRKAASQGAMIREGLSIVITGRPNAGKSTLINQLAQRDVAIVTSLPGTTRDVMRETVLLDDIPVNLIDTAGLRHSDDPIEAEGIKRAWQEVSRADCVLVVMDISHSESPDELTQEIKAVLSREIPLIYVFNQIDKINQKPKSSESDVYLSAKLGDGLELLSAKIKEVVGYQATEGLFIARRRHLHALDEAISLLKTGFQQLTEYAAAELLADDLRHAHQALAEITGEFSSDDLLGKIFSSFCIGK